MRAMDVMTTAVITVDPDTTVQTSATLLAERGISGAPVVDASRRLVGIVSEGDLLHRAKIGTARRHRERRRSWWLDDFASDFASELAREYIKSHGRTVKDIMTRDVVSVTEDTDLGEVAALLETKRVKRVPVTRDGKSSASSAGPTSCARSRRQGAGHSARAKMTTVQSVRGSSPKNGQRSGQRTSSSATVSCISGFPWTSPKRRSKRCGSRRKPLLGSAASRNTPYLPRCFRLSSSDRTVPLRRRTKPLSR